MFLKLPRRAGLRLFYLKMCVCALSMKEQHHAIFAKLTSRRSEALAEIAPIRPLRCPSCGSFDVRRSYPGGVWDLVPRFFDRSPLRCRRCNCRFYRKLYPGEELGPLDEPRQPVDSREES